MASGGCSWHVGGVLGGVAGRRKVCMSEYRPARTRVVLRQVNCVILAPAASPHDGAILKLEQPQFTQEWRNCRVCSCANIEYIYSVVRLDLWRVRNSGSCDCRSGLILVIRSDHGRYRNYMSNRARFPYSREGATNSMEIGGQLFNWLQLRIAAFTAAG